MKLIKGSSPFLLLSLAIPIHAAEVTFNGFLSTGIGKLQILDYPDAPNPADTLALSQYQPEENYRYFEYDTDIGFDRESIFALQVNSELDNDISLTGQLVGRGIDDYAVDVEWAFLSYRFSDDLTLRAGRLRIPFYMYSDFLEVGFAYPWVTPPRETYEFSPFSGYDGVDFVHTSAFGDWYSLIQGYWGNNNDSEVVYATGQEVQFDITLAGIAWTLSSDSISMRAGFHYLMDFNATNAQIETQLAGLANTFSDPLPGGGGISVGDFLLSEGVPQAFQDNVLQFGRDLAIEDDTAKVITLGVELDWEGLIFVAEHVLFQPSVSLYRETASSFVTFGYRFDETFLLHFTYEQIETDDSFDRVDDVIASAGTPSAGATPVIVGIETGLYIANQGAKRFNYGVGIRYDISASMAFKLGVQMNDVESRSIALQGLDPITVTSNIESALITAGVDLVF